MLRLALLCVWSLSAVQAYYNFQQKIPNGDQVPHPCQPNMMWQGVGHKNVGGGGFRNSFGVDFAANGFKWDRCICERDSDSDGRTNGEELGDPDCMWSEGGIPQITDLLKLSHPGVCEPVTDPKCMQINDWSFCDYDEKFECDTLKDEKPEDVIEHELRFPVTSVPAQETTYFCMTFDLPDDEEYHLVANEPILDNRQVMHHIILSGCDEAEDGNDDWKNPEPKECGMSSLRCLKMLAAWTVGVSGECSPKEYGIRVGKNGYRTVSMQVHWNNPEWKSGMTDSSGLKLYLTKNLRPNDGAILEIGSYSLEIPPRMESVSQIGTCKSSCTKMIQEPVLYIKDFSFHMHYLGRSGVFEHIRNGSVVNKIEEKYYNYDNPEKFIFEEPLEFHPGDELKITCNYKSISKSDTTYYGEGTSEEMCFGFITYYPEVKDFTACSSYKSIGACSIGDTFMPRGNCNTTSFFAAADNWMGSVMAACLVVQGCTDNCRQTVDTVKQNQPCLQGDRGELVQYFMIKDLFGEYGKPFIEAFNLCNEGWDRRIIFGNPKPKDEGSNVSVVKPTKPPMSSHHGDGDCVFEGDLSASAGTPWASIILMNFMLILSSMSPFLHYFTGTIDVLWCLWLVNHLSSPECVPFYICLRKIRLKYFGQQNRWTRTSNHGLRSRMLRLALLCVWSLSAVQAFFNFQQKLPNGDQVPHPCQPNMMWQGVGHKNVGGGGSRNTFGVDFAANGFKWDRCLCERDSDSDGRTNGEELGDPNCLWSEGGIPQITDILKLSHPGVCEPVTDPKCMQINDWSFCEYDEKFECETLDKENPADVIEREIRFPVTSVPARETTYFCMTFELPDDEEYHLVASEPILDNRQVMHHIILSGCDEAEDGNDDWKNTEPKECGMGSVRCRKTLAGWSVGEKGGCLPKEYGIRVGKNGYKTVSMQMHWNNPEWKTGMTDSSGLKLYLTKKLRPNDGAVLSVGSLSLVIPPRMESVTQVATCSSTCTKRVQEPILYVKDLSFHMHYLGRSAVFEHIRNGSVVNKVEAKYYSYDNPEEFSFEEPLEFHPGDELKVTCNYKSTSKSDTTYFGDGTSDEMCFGFLTYYPEVKDFSSCSSYNSVSTCSIGDTLGPLGNCNTTSFYASANTWMGSVLAACPLVQGCTDNCRQTVETLKRNEPCLQGDKGEFIQYFVIKEFFGEYGKPFIESFNLCNEGWDRRIIYGNPKPKDEGSNVSVVKPTKSHSSSHHEDGDCVFEGNVSASAGTPWASIILMNFMLVLSSMRLF